VLYIVHVTAFCLGDRFFRTRCMSINYVSTKMGDRSQVYRLSTWPSHQGQLSMAIPPWVSTMSTGNG